MELNSDKNIILDDTYQNDITNFEGNLLTKEEILMLLNTIREKAKEDLLPVKKKFRGKRRMNFDNEAKYKDINKRLYKAVEEILVKVSIETLNLFGVNQELFDKS